MPPKKAEPEPVVEEAEPEIPKLSAEEALAKALGMKLNPDKKMEVLMDRSASIQFDPKMKEITGTLTTHASQAPNVTPARAPFRDVTHWRVWARRSQNEGDRARLPRASDG